MSIHEVNTLLLEILLGQYQSRYNSIPLINPRVIRTPSINTLVLMSIRTQLYLYQYSIPLVNPQGIRTIPFNNNLVSMSIWTRLYLYQYSIPLVNPRGIRTFPLIILQYQCQYGHIFFCIDTQYNSQSISIFQESDSGRFLFANQETITLTL